MYLIRLLYLVISFLVFCVAGIRTVKGSKEVLYTQIGRIERREERREERRKNR